MKTPKNEVNDPNNCNELSWQNTELIQIFDNISTGIRIIDNDYKVLKSNKSFLTMTGLSESEVVGNKCYEICNNPLCNTPSCPLLHIREGEDFFETEIEMKRNDGIKILYHITARPFRNNQGKIIGIIEEFIDITEQKQIEKGMKSANERLKSEIFERERTEEILKERQRHYEALLKALPVGIFRIDEFGACVYSNEETSNILGLPVDKIKNFGWMQAIHPEDRDKITTEWEKCRSNKEVFRMECRFERLNGDTCWVAEKAVPYEGFNGQFWYIGTLVDITKYKLAKQALEVSEAKFKSYIDNSPDGIFIVDDSGKYIDVNPAGCAMLEYTKNELLQFSICDIDKTGNRIFEKLKKTGELIVDERVLRKKDGSSLLVELKAVPLGYDHHIGFNRDITKRKQIENALQKSEKQYRLIFENSPLGILHFDKEGRITACNERFIEILSSKREKLIGFNMLTELRDEDMSLAVKLAFSGKVGHYEGIYRSATSGSIVPLKAVFKGIISDNGELMGTVGIFEDIAERKNAEDALRKSEEQYRLIFENSPLGIVNYDKEGNITACNEKYIEILGSTREKLVGFNMVTEIQDNEMRAAIKLALLGRIGTYENNYCAVTSGKITPLKASYRGVISDDGELMGAVGILEDITERNKAEEALRQSEQYNNLIINGISEILVLYEVVDELNLRFVKVNNNFLKFIGFSEEQVIGKFIKDVAPKDIASKWNSENIEVIETHKPFSNVKDYQGYGTFEVNIIPIINDNKCTHIIVSALDITEKKKIEEHFSQIEKLESVGLLAGGIAHDFNNILTVIGGNISLLKMKINNVDYDKVTGVRLLTEAEKATLQAQNLTQQLLTFAKGGVPILRTTSIKDLLEETVNFTLRGSNLLCIYEISDGLWPVEIDEGQINQVIQNLIINAGHAMPEGGKIKLKAENIFLENRLDLPLKPGKYIKIDVEDQGVGIREEHLAKIFDPYFTTKQKGSGLGLATSFSIIKKHGGFITVGSKLGVGTVFHIYLPASQKQINEDESKVESHVFGKGRILVVDDEEKLREVVREILEHLGYEVESVSDGAEAIRLYQIALESEKRFDAVIMDLTIPGGMGGKETIQKLMKLDPEVKAIVTSGYSNDPVMANYKEYGFKAIATKPFSIEKLGEIVQNVIIT